MQSPRISVYVSCLFSLLSRASNPGPNSGIIRQPKLLKGVVKDLHVLVPEYTHPPLDRHGRHGLDLPLRPRPACLLVDAGAGGLAPQGDQDVVGRQAAPLAHLDEPVLVGDVLAFLEVAPEEPLHDLGLDLRAALLEGEGDELVGAPRWAGRAV